MTLDPKTGSTTGTMDSSFRTDRSESAARPPFDSGKQTSGKHDEGRHDNSFTKDLGEKAEDAAETLGERAHNAGEVMKAKGQEVMNQSRVAHTAICDFTERNPTAALLIAIGIGAFVARLLPRR